MTRTIYRLDCVGKTLPWSSLLSFLRHVPADSATYAATHKDIASWASPVKQTAVLADLVDMVNLMRWEFACAHTPSGERKPDRPRTYPRPGDKEPEPHVPFDKDEFMAQYFDN